ncbi:hypothetical protein BB559_002593 [Furculomyces boomerangus]|uniref:Uncharacterized protein n=1 Tax=Furculomyces boomerangus TaxID=61424 RepID=A0A2T9YU40_9FUNG|nr:hypothetical protein BB559_002593 [Furculomyces boomerangus]
MFERDSKNSKKSQVARGAYSHDPSNNSKKAPFLPQVKGPLYLLQATRSHGTQNLSGKQSNEPTTFLPKTQLDEKNTNSTWSGNSSELFKPKKTIQNTKENQSLDRTTNSLSSPIENPVKQEKKWTDIIMPKSPLLNDEDSGTDIKNTNPKQTQPSKHAYNNNSYFPKLNFDTKSTSPDQYANTKPHKLTGLDIPTTTSPTTYENINQKKHSKWDKQSMVSSQEPPYSSQIDDNKENKSFDNNNQQGEYTDAPSLEKTDGNKPNIPKNTQYNNQQEYKKNYKNENYDSENPRKTSSYNQNQDSNSIGYRKYSNNYTRENNTNNQNTHFTRHNYTEKYNRSGGAKFEGYNKYKENNMYNNEGYSSNYRNQSYTLNYSRKQGENEKQSIYNESVTQEIFIKDADTSTSQHSFGSIRNQSEEITKDEKLVKSNENTDKPYLIPQDPIIIDRNDESADIYNRGNEKIPESRHIYNTQPETESKKVNESKNPQNKNIQNSLVNEFDNMDIKPNERTSAKNKNFMSVSKEPKLDKEDVKLSNDLDLNSSFIENNSLHNHNQKENDGNNDQFESNQDTYSGNVTINQKHDRNYNSKDYQGGRDTNYNSRGGYRGSNFRDGYEGRFRSGQNDNFQKQEYYNRNKQTERDSYRSERRYRGKANENTNWRVSEQDEQKNGDYPKTTNTKDPNQKLYDYNTESTKENYTDNSARLDKKGIENPDLSFLEEPRQKNALNKDSYKVPGRYQQEYDTNRESHYNRRYSNKQSSDYEPGIFKNKYPYNQSRDNGGNSYFDQTRKNESGRRPQSGNKLSWRNSERNDGQHKPEFSKRVFSNTKYPRAYQNNTRFSGTVQTTVNKDINESDLKMYPGSDELGSGSKVNLSIDPPTTGYSPGSASNYNDTKFKKASKTENNNSDYPFTAKISELSVKISTTEKDDQSATTKYNENSELNVADNNVVLVSDNHVDTQSLGVSESVSVKLDTVSYVDTSNHKPDDNQLFYSEFSPRSTKEALFTPSVRYSPRKKDTYLFNLDDLQSQGLNNRNEPDEWQIIENPELYYNEEKPKFRLVSSNFPKDQLFPNNLSVGFSPISVPGSKIISPLKRDGNIKDNHSGITSEPSGIIDFMGNNGISNQSIHKPYYYPDILFNSNASNDASKKISTGNSNIQLWPDHQERFSKEHSDIQQKSKESFEITQKNTSNVNSNRECSNNDEVVNNGTLNSIGDTAGYGKIENESYSLEFPSGTELFKNNRSDNGISQQVQPRSHHYSHHHHQQQNRQKNIELSKPSDFVSTNSLYQNKIKRSNSNENRPSKSMFLDSIQLPNTTNLSTGFPTQKFSIANTNIISDANSIGIDSISNNNNGNVDVSLNSPNKSSSTHPSSNLNTSFILSPKKGKRPDIYSTLLTDTKVSDISESSIQDLSSKDISMGSRNTAQDIQKFVGKLESSNNILDTNSVLPSSPSNIVSFSSKKGQQTEKKLNPNVPPFMPLSTKTRNLNQKDTSFGDPEKHRDKGYNTDSGVLSNDKDIGERRMTNVNNSSSSAQVTGIGSNQGYQILIGSPARSLKGYSRSNGMLRTSDLFDSYTDSTEKDSQKNQKQVDSLLDSMDEKKKMQNLIEAGRGPISPTEIKMDESMEKDNTNNGVSNNAELLQNPHNSFVNDLVASSGTSYKINQTDIQSQNMHQNDNRAVFKGNDFLDYQQYYKNQPPNSNELNYQTQQQQGSTNSSENNSEKMTKNQEYKAGNNTGVRDDAIYEKPTAQQDMDIGNTPSAVIQPGVIPVTHFTNQYGYPNQMYPYQVAYYPYNSQQYGRIPIQSPIYIQPHQQNQIPDQMQYYPEYQQYQYAYFQQQPNIQTQQLPGFYGTQNQTHFIPPIPHPFYNYPYPVMIPQNPQPELSAQVPKQDSLVDTENESWKLDKDGNDGQSQTNRDNVQSDAANQTKTPDQLMQSTSQQEYENEDHQFADENNTSMENFTFGAADIDEKTGSSYLGAGNDQTADYKPEKLDRQSVLSLNEDSNLEKKDNLVLEKPSTKEPRYGNSMPRSWDRNYKGNRPTNGYLPDTNNFRYGPKSIKNTEPKRENDEARYRNSYTAGDKSKFFQKSDSKAGGFNSSWNSYQNRDTFKNNDKLAKRYRYISKTRSVFDDNEKTEFSKNSPRFDKKDFGYQGSYPRYDDGNYFNKEHRHYQQKNVYVGSRYENEEGKQNNFSKRDYYKERFGKDKNTNEYLKNKTAFVSLPNKIARSYFKVDEKMQDIGQMNNQIKEDDNINNTIVEKKDIGSETIHRKTEYNVQYTKRKDIRSFKEYRNTKEKGYEYRPRRYNDSSMNTKNRNINSTEQLENTNP